MKLHIDNFYENLHYFIFRFQIEQKNTLHNDLRFDMIISARVIDKYNKYDIPPITVCISH
jgi:hypothetical protein